jgi:hypothetical protein
MAAFTSSAHNPDSALALSRLIRKTVTSQIYCDKSVAIGQIRAHLPVPCEPTLRNTMDEHDWATARFAGLNKMELYAAAACDLVILHHLLLSCVARDRVRFSQATSVRFPQTEIVRGLVGLLSRVPA